MKRTIMLLIIGLLMIGLVSAAETPEPAKTNLQEIEYKQLLIEQQAKIQNNIRQELAKRDADIEIKINDYVDNNFQVLDERINEFIQKATFKLGMAFVSALVLGGSILLLINFQLNRKKAIKKRLVTERESLVLSGNTLTKIREQQEEPTVVNDEAEVLKQQIAALEQKIKKEKTKPTTKKIVEEIPSPTTVKSMTIKPMGND